MHVYLDRKKELSGRLDQMNDTDGKSMLDNSMIVYGSSNSGGNKETATNLPVVIAGGGEGTLQTGRVSRYDNMPMTNPYLSMSWRMGVTGVPRIGDSTGELASL